MKMMNNIKTSQKRELLYGEEQLSDRYLLRMLSQFVLPYWKELIVVMLMLLGVTALSLLPPYLIQQAVDGPITEGDLNGLIPFAVVYFLCIPALFALRFGHVYLLQTVGQNALTAMRQKVFQHILKQDMQFFNKTPVGQLVSRLSNDIDALSEVLSTSIVVVLSSLITLVGIILVMFVLNWRLALISLSVLPVMTIATVYFRIKIRQMSSRLHKVVADYQALTNEQFGGMLIVQLFGRQEQSRREFETVNDAYRSVHMRLRDQYTIFSSILQIMTSVGLALVLYGGGQGMLAEWATVGMLISFIQYTRRSFEPILQLSEQFTQIQTALSAGERLARMLALEPSIQDPENSSKHLEGRLKSITFDDVHFSYEAGTPVLRGINLQIEPGQRIAIVGATGAGKTSLAGLISRFYDVTSGSVRINGIDVQDLTLQELRRHVMVVPQNPYCFDGTIADNLRLFDPHVTDEQMREAAQTACAAPFIERLPDSYNFKLLPGGGNLSQGQRQLLALARALIHNPDSILVLDEATSSIDTQTEELIQRGLQRILKNRTSLIIAHRLSTVRDADRILVMKQGKIIEDGTHNELLELGGMYAGLYHRQFADNYMTPEAEAGD